MDSEPAIVAQLFKMYKAQTNFPKKIQGLTKSPSQDDAPPI